MRMRSAPFIVLMVCTVVSADAPTLEFSSRGARLARSEFTSKIAAAEKDYQGKLSVARKKYLAELEAAKEEATRHSELEEAVRIRDEIAAQKELAEAGGAHSQTKNARALLTSRLAGTVWSIVDGVRMAFNADGTVSRTDDLGGGGARWEALDGKTVVVDYGKGMLDRYVVDEKFTQLKAFAYRQSGSFDGTRTKH